MCRAPTGLRPRSSRPGLGGDLVVSDAAALTEEERDEERPPTASDERVRTAEEFIGDDLDPDEPRAGKLP